MSSSISYKCFDIRNFYHNYLNTMFVGSVFILCLPSLYLCYDYFGTKTSYFVNADTNTSLTPELDQCDIKLFWNFARHGTRNPGDDGILDMASKLPIIRDKLVEAWFSGNSYLTEGNMLDLSSWTFNITVEEESMLRDSGWEEHEEMGGRWRERLQRLQFNADTTKVRSSSKARCVDSAKAFINGMFTPFTGQMEETASLSFVKYPIIDVIKRGKREINYNREHPNITINNHLTRFYDECTKWQVEVEEANQTVEEANKLKESVYFLEMLENMAIRSGIIFSLPEVELMWNMCRYERAWEPELKDSPWCSVFSDDELSLHTFHANLRYYYANGYAYDINRQMTQPLLKDLLDALTSSDLETKVFLNFGHSDSVQPLIAALGLYRDEGDLLASDWPLSKDTLWDVSKIGSFASNIGVVLTACPSEGEVVALYHQEKMVEQPLCAGKLLCPLQEFVAGISEIANLDFESVCSN